MFAGWKPPELDVGVDAALERARGRLAKMLADERSSRYRYRLEALQQRVQKLSLIHI